MKKKITHLVPLTPQIIAALEELRDLTGSSKFLFQARGKSKS